MSIQLVDQCSKRLNLSFTQLKKLLTFYDSKEIQSLIYQSSKTEPVYNQIKDNIKLHKIEYQSKTTVLSELNSRMEGQSGGQGGSSGKEGKK